MAKFTVMQAKLCYDEYQVEAETPKQALELIENGKMGTGGAWIRLHEAALHDSFYDENGTVVVVDLAQNDRCGFAKTLFRRTPDDTDE